jgi:hypothetical protein
MPLPALDLLLGPQAAAILEAALGEYDAGLTALRIADAHVAPGGGVRVRYLGEIRGADGSIRRETLVATTGDRIPPGAAVLEGDVDGARVEVGVWRWPQDPALPALALATDPLRLAELLEVAGPLRTSVLGYRPGQRAVLEATDGSSRWFVKLVAPPAVADLQTRHALLGAVLPVPPIVASHPDGLIVLPEAPGTLLRALLTRDGLDGTRLPAPSTLQHVLDTLPAALLKLPPRPTHLRRVTQSARVLKLTADLDVRGLSDEMHSVAGPSVISPVHGDFHDGQLLVADGHLSALIDVDTAGPGERADEWATLLGHLSVLGQHNPRARSYGTAVLAHAERQTDPVDLNVRTAAVVLGLATGPFRTQRPGWRERTAARIGLAQQWIDRMRDHSSPPPTRLICTRDA